MDWLSFKTFLTDGSGLSRDALHILFGCGAWLSLVLLFRSWIGAYWPVAAVALAEIVNEWLDLSLDRWDGPMRAVQYWESAKDVLLTLAIPLVLVLLCRAWPARFTRPARTAPSE